MRYRPPRSGTARYPPGMTYPPGPPERPYQPPPPQHPQPGYPQPGYQQPPPPHQAYPPGHHPGQHPGQPFAAAPPPKKKPRKWPWILLAVVGVFIVIAATNSGGKDKPNPSTAAGSPAASAGTKAAATKPAVQPAVKATPAQEAGTVSQRNALRKAEDYLRFKGFSKLGLIGQLSSQYGEQFSKADATWAVAHLKVNWNEQAVRAGQSYLDMQGFSRAGLIQQLSSPYGDKFTKAEATYAANKLGL